MKTDTTANAPGLLIVLIFTMLLLSSCSFGPPTLENLSSADYGSPISQQDAEAQAQQFLRRYLKDPDSASYEWNPVYRGWMREAPIHGGGLKFGYILDGNINAKNSFGGYTGLKPYKFVFYNGNIVSVYAQQELRGSYRSTYYMGKIY